MNVLMIITGLNKGGAEKIFTKIFTQCISAAWRAAWQRTKNYNTKISHLRYKMY